MYCDRFRCANLNSPPNIERILCSMMFGPGDMFNPHLCFASRSISSRFPLGVHLSIKLSSHVGEIVISDVTQPGFHLLVVLTFFPNCGCLVKFLWVILSSFWSLCRLFGVLVSSIWMPLACFGLSVGSLYFFWCLSRLGCLWARGQFVALFWNQFGIICCALRGRNLKPF